MRSGFCVPQRRGLEKLHQVSLCCLIYIPVEMENTQTHTPLFYSCLLSCSITALAEVGARTKRSHHITLLKEILAMHSQSNRIGSLLAEQPIRKVKDSESDELF